MKFTARLIMGILFPFILIITVSSISKALKPEKTLLNKGIPLQNHSPYIQKSQETVPATFVVHKE